LTRQRSILVLGALLIAAALLLAVWPALRAGRLIGTSADASAPQEQRRLHMEADIAARALRLRFTRANGAMGELRLVRERDEGPWTPESLVDAPGIVFGDGYPVFASPRFMAVHGFDPRRALRPMSEAMLAEEADEVTVIRGWGGEIAVCLWRHDKVVRAYLAGGVFDALLAAPGEMPACERIEVIATAEGDAAPEGVLRDRADAARTAALAAMIAGCAARRDYALDQLMRNCDAGQASACDLLLVRPDASSDLWPEIDDLWRWIFDVIDASIEAPNAPAAAPSPRAFEHQPRASIAAPCVNAGSRRSGRVRASS